MIEIKELEFSYGLNKVFSNFEYSLNEPGVCGLLGPNGSGKTTLLKIIAGMLFPDSGSCKVFGCNSNERAAGTLRKLFFAPERFSLPPMQPAKYVALYAPFYPEFDQGLMLRLLNEGRIDNQKKLSALSLGEQKKFLLAFAFASGCELLLLDEPTNGLDIHAKQWFRNLLVTAGADKQIIVSTHQVSDLKNSLDRVVIIDGVKKVLDATVNEIADRYAFGHSSVAPAEALYSERVIQGFAYVSANSGEGYSGEPDLELLYKALVGRATGGASND